MLVFDLTSELTYVCSITLKIMVFNTTIPTYLKATLMLNFTAYDTRVGVFKELGILKGSFEFLRMQC